MDDEVENLRIFELTFRRDFSILTASSGAEALDLLSREPVSLVLSDQKMPGMLGTEFLERVARLDPKTVRVLVTAYGDADTLREAINSGSIYRFVAKPWRPEDMEGTIRRGIEVYALDRERDHLVNELTMLNQASRLISRELDSGSLANLLIETITNDFGYDAAGLLVFEFPGKPARWEFGAGELDEVSKRLAELKIDQDTAPRLVSDLQNGRIAQFTFDSHGEYELPVRNWVNEVAADEVVVIPLVGSAGLLGAIWCDNRRGGARFSTDDLTLLEGLAGQAAIAMENARLVEDLKRSREQVLRFDRLGTLGTLAAGIAHEINNPLVSIHTFLSMAPAKRHVDDEEFWGEYHSLASSEVDRIRRLVETMRQLGRADSQGAKRDLVDLTSLIEQVLLLVRPKARRREVELNFKGVDRSAKIVAVRDQMHQLIMNLLLNGIDACDAGGSVAVDVFASDDEVGFCVSDTGPGIEEEDLERIFDPFFTTKDPDEGTGLGLMICHRIVSDHNGTIEVRSSRGEGAAFRVRIPQVH